MKKITLGLVIMLSCYAAFAQDGYFVKAGFGIGTSSSSFNVLPGIPPGNHSNITSDQAQLNFGYTYRHIQLETGIGYLVTGLSYVPGGGGGGCVIGPNPYTSPVSAEYNRYTIKNAHLTVPLVANYIFNSRRKLSVSPGVGVEALYNFKGKMTSSVQSETGSEKIDYSYNDLGAAVVLKFDIQYKICQHLSVWCSPTYQNMISSLTTRVQGDAMSRIYDRAFLVSLGVKYNLHCPKRPAKS